MQTLFAIQRATLAARQRTGQNIGTECFGGRVCVVRFTRAVSVPWRIERLSDYVEPAQAVTILNHLKA